MTDTTKFASMLELDDADMAITEWDDDSATETTANEQIASELRYARTGCNNLAEAIQVVPELGGHVEKVPLFTEAGLRMPKAYGTIRTLQDGTRQGLGVVGERYRVVQDTEAFELMDALVADGTVRSMEAAVDGAKSWIRADLGLSAEIVKGDVINNSLIWANSHDGSLSLSMGFVGDRAACFNTCHYILTRDLQSRLKVRHTLKAVDLVQQAHDAVRRFKGEFDSNVERMQALTKVRVSDAQLKEYTGFVFSKWADTEEDSKDLENSRVYAKVLENFESGQGSGYAPGTAWTAYNAATEYITHRPRRGSSEEARETSLYFGQGAALAKRALEGAYQLA